jgi:serine protease AprX
VNVFCANPDAYTQITQSSGTSFACPLIAGVAALILSAHPEYTPDQVRQAMFTTANDADKPSNDQGYGVVNAFQAVLAPTESKRNYFRSN